MSNTNKDSMYKMPLTLEEHFLNLKNCYPRVEEIYNLWKLLKKQITEKLTLSKCVFANYSFHDYSHSQTILQMIERFLGEKRIVKLSATDTFMLLVCAYVHDYGMAQSIDKIYDLLGSDEFESFLNNEENKKDLLDDDDRWALENLMNYMRGNEKIPLNDLYFSIVLVVQTYLRPIHWKGVLDIETDFRELLQPYIRGRFIKGIEGIIPICMCHGKVAIWGRTFFGIIFLMEPFGDVHFLGNHLGTYIF